MNGQVEREFINAYRNFRDRFWGVQRSNQAFLHAKFVALMRLELAAGMVLARYPHPNKPRNTIFNLPHWSRSVTRPYYNFQSIPNINMAFNIVFGHRRRMLNAKKQREHIISVLMKPGNNNSRPALNRNAATKIANMTVPRIY